MSYNPNLPVVLFHILAKDKAKLLPYWLKTQLDEIDYPKGNIALYFRTNDNNDRTAQIISNWVNDQYGQGDCYSDEYEWFDIQENHESVDATIRQYDVHEWNPHRFKLLGQLRQDGINWAIKNGYDFYYTCDVDNFVKPHTLGQLVSYNLPVVAPLIRYALGKDLHKPYANFHNIASPRGYYQDNFAYYRILNGEVKGLIKCDVVHCTYLINSATLKEINYVDGTDDYEYVIFSRTLREKGIRQYLDNTELYGYLTLEEDLDAVKKWMEKLNADNPR
jgi:hypothetical protein